MLVILIEMYSDVTKLCKMVIASSGAERAARRNDVSSPEFCGRLSSLLFASHSRVCGRRNASRVEADAAMETSSSSTACDFSSACVNVNG